MLKQLCIENIAVIKKADIEFNNGFNVLTGETGAGKSILIDAINAVLGERTYKELIRSGCDSASVTAVFEPDVSARKGLESIGVFPDSEGNLFFQRTLNGNGRNICRINGAPVPLTTLKEAGEYLINIHGQHDNRNLLDISKHIQYLDKYAKTDALISDYRVSYLELKDIRRKIKDLTDKVNESKKMTDLYLFQKREIEASAIRPGERRELADKREIAKNSLAIRTKLEAALAALTSDDGAAGRLETAANELSSVKSVLTAVGDNDSKLLGFSYEISEIEKNISALLSTVDVSETELEAINERISVIDGLMRKYGGDEESILKYYDEISASLSLTSDSDEQISALESRSAELEKALVEKASRLTEARKTAALRFSEELCSVLRYLQMPNVRFEVDFKRGKYTGTGCDEIEFLISANAGQPPKPLAKIASGGELSRIMLAFKNVFCDIDDTDTMIFDEIDTGISGTAAEKVGAKLREIASRRQVICVTHLAQIAAKADNHYLIEKNMTENSTETAVKLLDFDERVTALARMISGNDPTATLLESSREMLLNK